MKSVLLLLSLLPCLAFAQKAEREKKQPEILKQYNQNRTTELRSDNSYQLDSAYVYYYGQYSEDDKAFSHVIRYTYDDTGRKIREVKEYDSEDDRLFQIAYTYEGDSPYPSEEITSKYADKGWEEIHKTTYSAGSRFSRNVREYRKMDGDWVLTEVETATDFDERGNPISIIDSVMGPEGGSPVIKFDILFDAEDIPYEAKFYYWDEDEEDWIFDQTSKLEWDERGNPISQIAEGIIDGETTTMFEVYYTYDERHNIIDESWIEYSDFGTYTSGTSYRNFYSDNLVMANNKMIPLTECRIGQDASGMLHIVLDKETKGTIRLICLNGKVVSQQPLNGSYNSLPTHSLQKGLYIIQVQTPEGTRNEKIIIK